MDTPGRPGQTDGEFRVGLKMAGLGMEVAAQVGAGAALGWLFDKWRGSAPTGLLVGSILGIVVGLSSLVRGALRLHAELEKQHPVSPRARPLPPEDEQDDWDEWKDDDRDDPGRSE